MIMSRLNPGHRSHLRPSTALRFSRRSCGCNRRRKSSSPCFSLSCGYLASSCLSWCVCCSWRSVFLCSLGLRLMVSAISCRWRVWWLWCGSSREPSSLACTPKRSPPRAMSTTRCGLKSILAHYSSPVLTTNFIPVSPLSPNRLSTAMPRILVLVLLLISSYHFLLSLANSLLRVVGA